MQQGKDPLAGLKLIRLATLFVDVVAIVYGFIFDIPLLIPVGIVMLIVGLAFTTSLIRKEQDGLRNQLPEMQPLTKKMEE
jgi:hypothetical protein